MYKNGHIGMSLLFVSPVVTLTISLGMSELAFLSAIMSISLASLPDVDMQFNSLSHRGRTHTAKFAVGVGVLLGASFLVAAFLTGLSLVVSLVSGFLVGFLVVSSHLVADFLTPSGVRPFADTAKNSYSLNIVTADDEKANRALLLVGLFSIVWACGFGFIL